MFITAAKEIIEACPTAKLDAKAADKLVRSIEEEEQAMLEPLIGYELMDALSSRYREMVDLYGGITTDCIDISGSPEDLIEGFDAEKTVKTIRLLRTIQSALVYRMLANKIYSISTSINLGGGANRASTGDYEPADDKHMQELRKEYFMNSRRMCDNILVLLEQDARSQTPMWIEDWKSSEGYFYKEDLLFPTLRSLKPFMTGIEPTKFLGLCQTIRYCQDTYIIPRVDADLMDDLLDTTHALTDNERKFQKQLRVALSYYIMSKEATRDERAQYLQSADSAMGTALAYYDKHLAPTVSTVNEAPHLCNPTASAASPSQSPCTGTLPIEGEGRGEGLHFSTLIPGVNRW